MSRLDRLRRRAGFLVCLACACVAILLGVRTSLGQPIGPSSPPHPAAPPAGLGSPGPRHFPRLPGTPPASPSGPGVIRLTTDDGERGPVVLIPKRGAYVGEFVVWNDGSGPLDVSRVAMRTDADDPRLPPHLSVRFADGSSGATIIQPHSSKRVAISWAPDRDQKARQAVGHVVVTSTDEVAGEVAMGFACTIGGPLTFLTAHLLTWLLLLPLFVALVAALMHVIGYHEDDRLRGLALGATGLQCLLAMVLYRGFRAAMTRVDGNDGFQLVERAVLSRGLGVEYFVGVDGTSVSLVLLLAIVGFAAAIASYRVPALGLRGYYALLSLLLAGLMGVFISLDLSVLVAFWILMLAALVGLVARAPASGHSRGPARRLAVYGSVSVACLVFALVELYGHSDPTFLADGTRVAHTFAIPELMRVAYNAKQLTLFGASWVKVVWGALFVAFAVIVPVVPFQRWFIGLMGKTAETGGSVETPVAMIVAAVLVKAGLYGLLRVSLGILPDGSRWAAATLVGFGVANIVFGAVSAVRQRDLRRMIAYGTVAQLGFCLVGMGSLTREGLAGCLIQMCGHGLVMAVLVFLVGALYDRLKTCELTRLSGLAGAVPLYTAVAGVAMLAAAGAPGLPGFWGELIPVLGAFPRERVLAACAAAGAVVSASAYLLAIRRVFFGALAESWKPHPDQDRSGGTLHELGPRELAAVMPLLLLCVVLGLFPGSFFALVQGGVSDLNQLVNPPGPDEIA